MKRDEEKVHRRRRGLERAVEREEGHVVSAYRNVKAHERHLEAARDALRRFNREYPPSG